MNIIFLYYFIYVSYLNVSIFVKISLYNKTWYYVSFVVFSVQIFSKYPTMQFEPVMRPEHNIMHSARN